MKLFLFILVIISHSMASDFKVFFVKGDASAVNLSGITHKLKNGDLLSEGNIIKTGKDSFIILKIDGHSNHRIEENSEIMVEDLPYNFQDSDELEEGGSVIIKVGTIFSDIISKADIPTFQVKTKNTVMGVRGTTFMASVNGENDDVYLTVHKGEVEVFNTMSELRDVIRRKETIVVEKDAKPTLQRKYKWSNKLQWDVTSIDFNKVKKFSEIKNDVINSHKKVKKPWVRNELKFKEARNNWDTSEKKWLKRTENLKSNSIRQSRKREVYKSLKKMKTYFRETMLKNENPELNEFIRTNTNTIDERLFEEKLKKKNIQEKILRRRLPPPGQSGPLPPPPKPPGPAPIEDTSGPIRIRR